MIFSYVRIIYVVLLESLERKIQTENNLLEQGEGVASARFRINVFQQVALGENERIVHGAVNPQFSYSNGFTNPIGQGLAQGDVPDFHVRSVHIAQTS